MRRRDLVDDDVVEVGVLQQAGHEVGVVERERSGHPGRWHGRAELGAHRVEHDAEPRVAFTRSPHDGGQASAGS